MLDEHTQFVDDSGLPYNNGYIYIGVKGADAKISPTTIYSDEDLTVVLSNPQRIESFGRSVNKIWVAGKYSIKVEDENNVQVYNQLDTGESVDTGTTSLTNILGTNAITGEGIPTVTTLVDKEIFTLTIANDNTGDVTLKVDNTPAKSCRINFDQQIRPRQLRQGMIAKFTYNLTADYYEWTNQNLTTVHQTKGADIASATTITIPADGNYHDVTGTTTITGINSVAVGTVQKLHFDGALILTHNATTLILPGGKNLLTEADDEIELIEYSAGNFRLRSQTSYRGQTASVIDSAVATGTTQMPGDDTIPQITEGFEVMSLAFTPKSANSKLKIDINIAIVGWSAASAAILTVALFVDTTANALAASGEHTQAATNNTSSPSLVWPLNSGSTTTRTYRVRIGVNSPGTVTFNGSNGARVYGGVAASSMIITETFQ